MSVLGLSVKPLGCPRPSLQWALPEPSKSVVDTFQGHVAHSLNAMCLLVGLRNRAVLMACKSDSESNSLRGRLRQRYHWDISSNKAGIVPGRSPM